MEKQKISAPVFMMISALSFAAMSASVKYAIDVPFIQKVLFRNIIMLLLSLPILLRKLPGRGISIITGSKENRARLLLRSITGLAGVLCYFYSVSHLPLGDSAMLNKLSAFFVMLLAGFFLKEKIKKYQIPALFAAFIGALLIIKPYFSLTILPAIAGMSGALLAGCAYTIIASIKGKEDTVTIIFWFSFISTIVTLVPSILYWKDPLPLELTALVFTGVFAAGGQYFLTKAYSLGNAGEVSIFNYTQVLFSVLLDLIFWKQIPDGLSVVGSILIISAAFWLLKKSARK